jgi:hypothetical protein
LFLYPFFRAEAPRFLNGRPSRTSPQRFRATGQTHTADSGKCVGVISAIGDTFAVQRIGLTVFGNELTQVPIDSWQIDNLVVGKISAFLSKSWTVRRINYAKGAFSSLDGAHPLFYDYEGDLQAIVRRVTSSTKCDHYVVVLRSGSGYGTANQTIHGLGIVEAGSPIWLWDYIYALYSIRLYDGQTLAVQGRQAAKSAEEYIPTIRGPSREVDKSWWPQSDAAQSTKLRDGIRSLVDRSLEVTMPLILRIE